jgi:hypothetical protein
MVVPDDAKLYVVGKAQKERLAAFIDDDAHFIAGVRTVPYLFNLVRPAIERPFGPKARVAVHLVRDDHFAYFNDWVRTVKFPFITRYDGWHPFTSFPSSPTARRRGAFIAEIGRPQGIGLGFNTIMTAAEPQGIKSSSRIKTHTQNNKNLISSGFCCFYFMQ